MFIPYKGIPDDAGEFDVRVIGNSKTVTVGDALVTGATTHTKSVGGAASSTTTLVGVLAAILNAQYGYTGLNSVTAGSSNETTPVYYAQYIPLSVPGILFLATLSQTAGTTTDSDGMGSFNMYSTNDKLDETSIALDTATLKQFWSKGLDTRDTAKLTVIGHFNPSLSV